MQKNKTGIILFVFIFVIGVLLPVFLFETGKIYNLVIKPLSWLFLLVLTLLFSKKKTKSYNFDKKAIFEISLMYSLIYIILYYSLGLIIGYSKSPFDRSLLGIINNIWIFIPFIVFREIIRDYIIKFSKKGEKKLIIIITLIMIFTDISYASFEAYSSSLADIIEFSIKTFLPAACLNVFLSYICYRESYKSSIIYLIPIMIIKIITPVFPYDLFFVLIIVDLLIPFMAFLKIENLYTLSSMVSIYKKNDFKSILGKVLGLMFLVFTLLFTTRLLPISPIVILSDSMAPYIERGDIALIKKIESSNIKINDIIEYRIDDVYVIHRVVNIKKTDKGCEYITKGDNNKSVDSKVVLPNQINGKFIGYVPKMGFPTIWIREFLEEARGLKIKEGDRI